MKENHSISFFFVLLFLLNLTSSLNKCNLNLLATFKLRGLKESINDQMQVCPHVYHRCCSLMDEVRIVQLWNIYGKQQVRVFSNNVANLYKQFYLLHALFTQITTREMVFHYLSFNVIRPLQRICGQNTRIQDLRRWGKFLELQRMFPGNGPVRRVGVEHRFSNFVRVITRLVINDADEIIGDARFTRHLKDSKTAKEKLVTRSHRKLLSSFLDSPIKKFVKVQADFKTASMAFQKESKLTDRILDYLPSKLVNKIKKVKKINQNDNNKKPQKQKKIKARSLLNRSLRSIIVFVPRGNSFLRRFRFFTRVRVPFIPVNLEIPVMQCRTRFGRVMKPFLVLNENKYHFCHLSIDNLAKVDSRYVMANLENIKMSLISIMELKKSLYCSICDVNEQKMFDINRGILIYSQEFCYDLLSRYKDYIFFKNIAFVEYVDNLLQIQECVQSTGDENTFPSLNRFSWMRRRIAFIRRCYDHLETPQFYVYCRFMCVQYRIQDTSNFFEGDIKIMNEVFSSIMSFLRARRSTRIYRSTQFDILAPSEQPRRNNTNATRNALVDNDEEFNLDAAEQQLSAHVLNMTDFSFTEHAIKGEIFERIQEPLDVCRLRTYFATNMIGINPISAYNLIDFRIQISDILNEQSKRENREVLEVGALEGYFDSKLKMVKNFNNDLNLEFIDDLISKDDFENDKNIERRKRLKNNNFTLIENHGIGSKFGNESLTPDVPEWNTEFSRKEEPDKLASWFNYFFHTK